MLPYRFIISIGHRKIDYCVILIAVTLKKETRMFKWRSCVAVVVWLLGSSVGVSHAHNDSMNSCLLKRIQSAGNDVTVEELNRRCGEELASQKSSELHT